MTHDRSLMASGSERDPLRRLDAQTLRALCILIEESHVSKAAERLGVTQPSMSAVLAQLREVFNDPILIRTNKGMIPTSSGIAIARLAKRSLDLLEEAMSMTREFDPYASKMTFRINATESVGFILVPPLTRLLESAAPGVRIEVSPSAPSRMLDQLQQGEADVVVAYQPHAPDMLYMTTLYQQQLRVVAASSHPRIEGRLTPEQYRNERHVYYKPAIGVSSIERQVDQAFAERGWERQVGIVVPSALASAPIAAASNHLATVTRAVAEHAARANDLQVLKPPIPLGVVRVAMFWHERTHASSAHAWLRKMIKSLFH